MYKDLTPEEKATWVVARVAQGKARYDTEIVTYVLPGTGT
jgi:hypothetical protein